MQEIKNLKEKIVQEIDTRKEQPKSILNDLAVKTFSHQLTLLDDYEEIIDIEKYQLAFMGTIGTGKSTAICHLFDFLYYDKKGFPSTMLKTASGRTTICETVVKIDEITKIYIEPKSDEEFKAILKDFIVFIKGKIPSQNNQQEGEENRVEFAIELERALRNILNLNLKQDGDKIVGDFAVDYYKEIKNKVISENQEKELSEKEIDEKILDNLLLKSKLDERIKTEIIFDESLKIKEFEWVKKEFEKINDGKNPLFPIPKEIIVCVNQNSINKENLNLFETIIDTKGLDNNPSRPDIIEYSEKKDVICVLTTPFNAAPDTNCMKLIEDKFKDKTEYIEDKFVLLVLPRKGEEANVNSANGNPKLGRNIKRNEVESVFSGKTLNFKKENIMFYSPLSNYVFSNKGAIQGYESENEEETDDDVKLRIENEKKEIIFDLVKVIGKRKQHYIELYKDVESKFENIIQRTNEITKEEQKILHEIYDNLLRKSNLNYQSDSGFVNLFCEEYFGKIHWATKRAISRNFGIHPTKDYNIYFDGQWIFEKNLEKFSGKIKDDLSKIFENAIENIENELLRDVLKTQNEKLQHDFEDFYKDAAEKIGDKLEELRTLKVLHEPSDLQKFEFWYIMGYEISGKGSNIRMKEFFKRIHLQDLQINEFIKETVDTLWEKFIDTAIEFFGEVK